MIEIKNVSKSFGKKIVLQNVNVKLEGNQIVGLLGQNGSGKTTLLKIIAGLIQDFKGEILIDGKALGPKMKEKINYLPAESFLEKEWDIRTMIDFHHDMFPGFDRVKAREIMERFGLDDRQKIKTMSTGIQEKLETALVMSRKSPIYLLDEPLGGIDVSIRRKILENIIRNYAEGSLMVISTHLIGEVETIIDRAVIIKDQTIYSNRLVEDIREREGKNLEDYFVEIFEEEDYVF